MTCVFSRVATFVEGLTDVISTSIKNLVAKNVLRVQHVCTRSMRQGGHLTELSLPSRLSNRPDRTVASISRLSQKET